MSVTYHRVDRIHVPPALAAAGAAIIVGGIALTILAIVATIWWTTRALRALGFIVAVPRLAVGGDDTIEGVVVHRSSARRLER